MCPNKLISTHECSDEDGNEYTVHEYQEFDEKLDDSGNLLQNNTTISYVLSGGSKVLHRDGASFEIFPSGKIIKKRLKN